MIRTYMKLKFSLTTVLAAMFLASCGGSGTTTPAPPGVVPPPPPADTLGPSLCVGGIAATFPCLGMKLHKRVPLSDFNASAGNDIWGWTDPNNGDEYALMGLSNGVSFVRITDPENPVLVGKMTTQTAESTWRDIKVYQNHAFVVADNAGAHGIQIFDLTRLRGISNNANFSADVVFSDINSAHNIVINEDSGFAYVVGSNRCAGGLYMLNIANPVDPIFAGCHSNQGYTHDAQCVIYNGPDTAHVGKEICFRSNENSVSISNVTNKSAPVTLSSATYPNFGYTHQNWIDETHSFLFVGDETDEVDRGIATSTIVLDVRDLNNAQFLYTHVAGTNASDHNMYVVGDLLYQANYHAGLRILQFGDLSTDTLNQVRFFDTYPANNASGFDGAWSVYPFFASGNIIVSDIDRGLFIVAEE
ncbi:MAG: choice-of-anchor B family protein [Hellea sp.]|nr:choice-of-anchor B family protein [Hellea sp.]